MRIRIMRVIAICLMVVSAQVVFGGSAHSATSSCSASTPAATELDDWPVCQVAFQSAGDFVFTPPPNVSVMGVLVIGGGGGAAIHDGNFGGGGGEVQYLELSGADTAGPISFYVGLGGVSDEPVDGGGWIYAEDGEDTSVTGFLTSAGGQAGVSAGGTSGSGFTGHAVSPGGGGGAAAASSNRWGGTGLAASSIPGVNEDLFPSYPTAPLYGAGGSVDIDPTQMLKTSGNGGWANPGGTTALPGNPGAVIFRWVDFEIVQEEPDDDPPVDDPPSDDPPSDDPGDSDPGDSDPGDGEDEPSDFESETEPPSAELANQAEVQLTQVSAVLPMTGSKQPMPVLLVAIMAWLLGGWLLVVSRHG